MFVTGAFLGTAALLVVACARGGEPGGPAPLPQQPGPAAQPILAAPATDPAAPASVIPIESAPARVPGRQGQPALAPKYGGEVTLETPTDPLGGFDPHIAGQRKETRSVIGLALESVAVYDLRDDNPCTAVVRPLLAESWSFLDPTTIEIKLRQGVKFQNVPPVNGRELVADDVVFNYQRSFDRGLNVASAGNINSMEAVDKYAVRIKTKRPMPIIADELFAEFHSGPLLAKEAANAQGGFDKRENIIGTGPFILTQYTPGVGHLAVRNPEYWAKGLPYLDRVRVSIIRDLSTQFAAFQVGKLDFLSEVLYTDRNQLIARKAKVWFVPCQATNRKLNMRTDIPPFNDVRLRRALSMALAREDIIKGIFGGFGSVIGMHAEAYDGALKHEEFPPEVRKYIQYNPTEAKRLLAEAGYPDDFDLEIVGSRDPSPLRNLQFEVLPGMLRASGFNTKLTYLDRASYTQIVTRGKYDQVIISGGSGSAAGGLEVQLKQWHSSAAPYPNTSLIKDSELDRLLDQMLETVDRAERIKLMHKAETRIVDQAFLVMFPAPTNFNAVSQRVQGIVRIGTPPGQNGWRLREVWMIE